MSRAFGSTILSALQGQQQAAQGTAAQIQRSGEEATRATEASGAATSAAQGRAQAGATANAQLQGQTGRAIGDQFNQAFQSSIARRFQLNAKLQVMQEAANLEDAKREAIEARARHDKLAEQLGMMERMRDIPTEGLPPEQAEIAFDFNTEKARLGQEMQNLLTSAQKPQDIGRAAAARAFGSFAQFRQEQAEFLKAAGQFQKAPLADLFRKTKNEAQRIRVLTENTTAVFNDKFRKIPGLFGDREEVSDPEILSTLFGPISPFLNDAAHKVLQPGLTPESEAEARFDVLKRMDKGEFSAQQLEATRDSIREALGDGPNSIQMLMKDATPKLKRRVENALRRFEGVLDPLSASKPALGVDQRRMFVEVGKAAMEMGLPPGDPELDTKIMGAIAEADSIDGTTSSALLSPDPAVRAATAQNVLALSGLGPGGEAAADIIKSLAQTQKNAGIGAINLFGQTRPPVQFKVLGGTTPGFGARADQEATSSKPPADARAQSDIRNSIRGRF